jgi:hypothetical protein
VEAASSAATAAATAAEVVRVRYDQCMFFCVCTHARSHTHTYAQQ